MSAQRPTSGSYCELVIGLTVLALKPGPSFPNLGLCLESSAVSSPASQSWLLSGSTVTPQPWLPTSLTGRALSCSCFGFPLIWTHQSPMSLYFVTPLFPQALATQHPGHPINGFPGSYLLSTSWDLVNALGGSPKALSPAQCPADPGGAFH